MCYTYTYEYIMCYTCTYEYIMCYTYTYEYIMCYTYTWCMPHVEPRFFHPKRPRVLCAMSHELCTWVTNCMNMRHKVNWYESRGCAVCVRVCVCVCCASRAVYIVRDLCVTNDLYVEQVVLHVQCDIYIVRGSWVTNDLYVEEGVCVVRQVRYT